jgi:hypothetical protein
MEEGLEIWKNGMMECWNGGVVVKKDLNHELPLRERSESLFESMDANGEGKVEFNHGFHGWTRMGEEDGILE